MIVLAQGALGMSKVDNAKILDPNRFKVAKNMTTMPGGPENNNPMNVTDIANPEIQSSSIYGDYQQNYPQMGTGMVNPQMVQNSGLPQNMPIGQGKNAGVPFGMQKQPSMNAEEPMEGMRLGQDAMNRGLTTSQFMGMSGSAALMPGALDPTIPGSGTSMNALPTSQQVVGGEMVPGSTPTKIKKKGKK
jgi:hypothetical protein